MNDLAKRELIPPRNKDVQPLQGSELNRLQQELGGDWQVIDGHHLEKTYKFMDFVGALEFTNRIGDLAESVDHHPEICLTWGRVTLTIWTHSIGGLSEADFIFAARSDRLANAS
jgi:4a-hydroxytetrahydrobiopterin dehydratase